MSLSQCRDISDTNRLRIEDILESLKNHGTHVVELKTLAEDHLPSLVGLDSSALKDFEKRISDLEKLTDSKVD